MKIEWFEVKYSFQRKWDRVYYPVKDFFFPWNKIKLRNVPRHYVDVNTLIEETLCQLLEDFFDKQQPFNFFEGYVKKPSVEFHRKLLEKSNLEDSAYWNDARCAVWTRLLDILEWYRNGGLRRDGTEVWCEAIKQGVENDEANQLMAAFDKTKSDNLKCIVEYRDWLWT